MAARRKQLKSEPPKREATVFTGLPTPNQSMTISNGATSFFKSHDGLPREHIDLESDEGYGTQVQEIKRRIRSPSPSIQSFVGSFRQPSLIRRQSTVPSDAPRPSIAPSMAAQSIANNIGGSLQIVGEKVKLLVDAIEDLRKLGLREIDTELPELVLIGDQSAGKSSLMGAIAEINLPKNKGMCTRCPANIKTSSSEDGSWSCVVSLHENYYHSQEQRRTLVPTKNQPFPPWKENIDQTLNIRPFKTIFDKAELEEVLKWAQIALLNPSQDYRLFVPGSGSIAQHGLKDDHKNEADFSPNVVAIEISGPGLPALSFYDLPGIFVSAPNKDEQYLIKVFENLAAKYIKKQNALIICAITMSADPGTSRASAIIGQHKAENRTIGVLTMPDRLSKGSTHMDYDSILRGKTHILPRGYFVTKQPDNNFKPEEFDYHVQAREEEESFFNSDSRWTGEWQDFRHRCGTRAIQTYLSQEFARLIANSMPNIDEKIKARTAQVDESLRHLPELPGHNVQHVVRQCLQEFSNTVKSFLQGGANSNEFLSAWGQLSVDFGYAIQEMKPKFIFTDPSDLALPEVINIDDSDEETVVSAVSPSSARKHSSNEFSTPQAKRQMLPTNDAGNPFYRGSVGPIANGPQQFPKQEGSASPALSFQHRPFARPKRKSRETVFDEFLNAGSNFSSIGKVRAVISKYKRPGHPDNVTDAAREEMCLQSIKAWDGPVGKLADVAFEMLRAATMGALNQTLGKYKQTDLYRESKRHIRKFLSMHQNEQRVYLQSFYDIERYKLFTLNEDAFAKYKAEELQLLQARRRERRVKCFIDKQAKLDGKSFTDAKKVDMQKAIKDEQLGPDPFSREIDTAAYVRGYYKTAGFRFADNLCQNIQGMLFRKVHNEIAFLLEGLLGLNEGDSEAKCRVLMNEDDGEARLRAQLQDEKSKLSKAASHLEELVHRFGITPDRDDDDMDEDELMPHGHYSPPRADTAPLDDLYGH